ncbi:uncharacterized protein RHO25_011146 [Cercospora beticola]|uniref:Uncharacterized protein n=1 Tax=Cercospora beticola TaxID=122368 RepID=A0ABZ0P3Q2_CERBT|nr:hypothetical protein RHO25_011146 [Cercospora beticola]
MSALPSAQYSVAATRVFGTMELLEMILLEVAHAEINLPESTPSESRPRNVYIRSPIILRAVNRDFRNTIDGSSQLLRLRLKAVPPQATQDYYDLRPALHPGILGPLHWLGEQHYSYAFINGSNFRDGVLLLRAIVYDPARSHQEDKMRENPKASWRKLPCWTDGRLVSRVNLEMHYVWYSACRRKSGTVKLPTQNLGPAPTLGMLCDAIHGAKVALQTEKQAED